MAIPTLHQFAFSHFNEKARWALDYKGIAHRRETYLPGPHMAPIKRLSGQTATPVLQQGDVVTAGSAAIIEVLEHAHPEPALYPDDAALRQEALAWQAHYDATVGPAVRTVVFSILVNEGGYLCAMFGGSKGVLKRTLYRASFPLARGLIAKGNGVVDPNNVERCYETTRQALGALADRVGATGYVVGDAFSIADLTSAALFAPIAALEHPDMRRPRPVPAAFAEMVAEFASHPGIQWVESIYARYRSM
ncbi:MAG: glutathione S-transferase family protein [Pseudomonadota bacterium]